MKERTQAWGLRAVAPRKGGVIFQSKQKAFKLVFQKGVAIANFFLAVFVLRRTGAALEEVDDASRRGMRELL